MLPDASERGIAVVATLLALVLVSALGTALLLLSGGETLAAANYRDALVATYAAEAAVEQILPDLQQKPPNFTAFAHGYNGAKTVGYDVKMRNYYRQYSK